MGVPVGDSFRFLLWCCSIDCDWLLSRASFGSWRLVVPADEADIVGAAIVVVLKALVCALASSRL